MSQRDPSASDTPEPGASAAAQLRLERELYRDLVDSQPHGIYRVRILAKSRWAPGAWLDSGNAPAELDMVNARFCEITGVPKDAWLDNPGLLNELVHPEDRERFASSHHELMASRTRFRWEGRLVVDGRIVWALFESIPRVLDNGDLLCTGTLQDITWRKRAELEHEQLNQLHRLESLGTLAAGIAHDFNNLLAGIYGHIGVAETLSDDPEVLDALAGAAGTIETARGLARQLLTFSRGGAPAMTTQSLVPFLEESARFALRGSSVSCRCELPHDLWPCSFDKGQLGQAIGNLVVNARQAMPEGGVIALTAANTVLRDGECGALAGGRYVSITLADTGGGISKEHLPRLFAPFFSTKATGRGLGLAVTHSIISRHGGRIDVQSELGKGTSFRVLLPASREPAPASSAPAPADRVKASAGHTGTGVFVILDDEKVVRDFMARALRLFGYTTVCLDQGDAVVAHFAAERAAGRSVAGMILDLTIPGGKGGKDVCAEIRRMCHGTPIFVASGYSDDPVLASPERYGFTAAIPKPFGLGDLAARLNEFMPR